MESKPRRCSLAALQPAGTNPANTTAALPNLMTSALHTDTTLLITSVDWQLTWMFRTFICNHKHTHRRKHTNLVFQSSSDFERFLRAVLCFSSSLFFSSLARSCRNKNTQTKIQKTLKQRQTLLHLTQKINMGSSKSCPFEKPST